MVSHMEDSFKSDVFGVEMCIRDRRMNELATQAANGTNSKDSDRQAIQDLSLIHI